MKIKHLNRIGYFLLRKEINMPKLISKLFFSFYEKSILQQLLIREQINCVLDIGSHKGSFIQSLRKIGYKKHIISFEPTLSSYQYLKNNFSDDKNLICYNIALGDFNGKQKINTMGLSNLNSFLDPIDLNVKSKINVKVKKLDEIMPDILKKVENPKIFCKIDTQGYDLNVLKGAGEYVNSFKILQSEISIQPLYKNTPNYIQSFEYFESIGFKVIQLFPCSKNNKLNETLEFDCIMIRK